MTIQFRLAYLELKKTIFNKGFGILVFLILGIIYLLPPYNMVLEKTKSLPAFTLPIIMIVYFSQILTCEFEHKTFKVLFTGGLSRLQVIISKVISMISLGILFCLSYQFLLAISQIIETKSFAFNPDYRVIANSLFVFIIYSLAIITFEMLLMSVTLSFPATFIITFVFFNGFVTDLLKNATNKLDGGLIQKVVEYVPFRVAVDGLKLQSYTTMQTIVVVISSLVLFGISSLILMRKDLR